MYHCCIMIVFQIKLISCHQLKEIYFEATIRYRIDFSKLLQCITQAYSEQALSDLTCARGGASPSFEDAVDNRHKRRGWPGCICL